MQGESANENLRGSFYSRPSRHPQRPLQPQPQPQQHRQQRLQQQQQQQPRQLPMNKGYILPVRMLRQLSLFGNRFECTCELLSYLLSISTVGVRTNTVNCLIRNSHLDDDVNEILSIQGSNKTLEETLGWSNCNDCSLHGTFTITSSECPNCTSLSDSNCVSSTEEEKCVSLSLKNIPVHNVKCRVLSCGGRTDSHCASIQVSNFCVNEVPIADC